MRFLDLVTASSSASHILAFGSCTNQKRSFFLKYNMSLEGRPALSAGGWANFSWMTFFDKLLGLDTAIWSVHLLVRHKRLAVHFGGNLVACWHHVVVVDVLHERLHACTLCNLLLGHHLCALEGCAVNAGHQGVWEAAVLRAIVKGLNDHGLPACIAALKEHDDAVCLDEFAHGCKRENSMNKMCGQA